MGADKIPSRRWAECLSITCIYVEENAHEHEFKHLLITTIVAVEGTVRVFKRIGAKVKITLGCVFSNIGQLPMKVNNRAKHHLYSL
jgi:hypothetical protein